jgi:hypothetical protein
MKRRRSKKSPRRFMFWRRSVAELNNPGSRLTPQNYPTIDTLEHKLEEARELIAKDLSREDMVIVEIVKVVRKASRPIEVEDFKGYLSTRGGCL